MFRKYKFLGTVMDKWLWFLHLFVNLFLCLYLGRLVIVNGFFIILYFMCFVYSYLLYVTFYVWLLNRSFFWSTTNRQAHIDKNTDFDFARKCQQGCSCISFLLTSTQLEMSIQMFGVVESFSLLRLVLFQHLKTASGVCTKKSHRNICMFCILFYVTYVHNVCRYVYIYSHVLHNVWSGNVWQYICLTRVLFSLESITVKCIRLPNASELN